MTAERIHQTVSDDGTRIAGRVHGQGPPLVLVPGPMDDGSDWDAVLPVLAESFTCYVVSTRSRGLSDPHPDLSRERHVQDVTAFVTSVGDGVGVAGISGGGMPALGAAARAPAVSAVAAYEPVVFEVIGDEVLAEFRDRIARMVEAAVQGRPAEAALAFLEFCANDREYAFMAALDSAELAPPYLPVDLLEIQQALDGPGPSPTGPGVLARIGVPALLLHGTHSGLAWFADGVHYAARHIPAATVREIAGAGHFGPRTHPEQVADELVTFFAQSARRVEEPAR